MKFCQKCDYTCNRCQSDGATCIDCPTGSFRTFNGVGGCPCDGGYFSDVGNRNPVCLACDYTCATC